MTFKTIEQFAMQRYGVDIKFCDYSRYIKIVNEYTEYLKSLRNIN